MPNAGMRAEVPPIKGEPSPHGLLGGCIEVVTTRNVHELNGTQMRSTSCAKAHPWQDCPDPAGGWTNPTTKVFDPVGYCSFEPVTATAGVRCNALGLSHAEANAAAMDQLSMGEQWVLENWFMTRFLANATHTTDLTPAAGAVHIVNGIGILETWLAVNYGGSGVIHAPIGTASLMSMHTIVDFATEERCPQTLAGNAIVIGAGYSSNLGPATPPTAPVPAPSGRAWLYITPPMRIRRDTPFLAQNAEWQTVDTTNNDRKAQAETTFVPEVACCMAAGVMVDLSACC